MREQNGTDFAGEVLSRYGDAEVVLSAATDGSLHMMASSAVHARFRVDANARVWG